MRKVTVLWVVLTIIAFPGFTLAKEDVYPSFVWEDEETGASFTVPENWYLSEATDYPMFVSANNMWWSISFSTRDFGDYFSDVEESGIDRQQFEQGMNQSVLRDSAVMESMKESLKRGMEREGMDVLTSTEPESIFCGENEYVAFEMQTYRMTAQGIIILTAYGRFHMDNGIFYEFVLWGNTSDPVNGDPYGDYEALLSSVQFPEASADGEARSVEAILSPDSLLGRIIVGVLAAGIATGFVKAQRTIQRKWQSKKRSS